MVSIISSIESLQKNIQNDKLVVIDFFAEWCGPCKQIKPFFYQLSSKYPKAKFYSIDVDKSPDISQYCEIHCMPTFQFYFQGHKVEEVTGNNQEMILDKLNMLYPELE